MLVGAGSAGSSIDAANILKPALARGELQCIGATTLDEYRKHIESDAALERRFQPVMVDEPTQDETVEILRGIKHAYEQHHKLLISDDALLAAARLSTRFVPDRFLPDKAIDVMDEAASRVKMYKSPLSIQLREVFEQIQDLRLRQAQYKVAGKRRELADLKAEEGTLESRLEALRQMRTEEDEELTVGPDDIAEIIAMWTGIPMTQIAEEESRRLLEMEQELHKRHHRTGRGHRGRGQGRAPGPCWPERPKTAHRLLHLPWAHRGRQDRALQGAWRASCSAPRRR